MRRPRHVAATRHSWIFDVLSTCRRTGTLGCSGWTSHWWRCSNARCGIWRAAAPGVRRLPPWASRSSSRPRSRSTCDGWDSTRPIRTRGQWFLWQVRPGRNEPIIQSSLWPAGDRFVSSPVKLLGPATNRPTLMFAVWPLSVSGCCRRPAYTGLGRGGT